MSAFAFAVGAFDWTVDGVRAGLGLPPLPPDILILAFERPPVVRVPVELRVQTRRTIHAFLRLQQDQLTLFEGTLPRDGRVGITPLTPGLIRMHLALESRHPMARHGRVVMETLFEPSANGPPLEIEAPKEALAGKPLICAWHAPAAQRVHIAIIEGSRAIDSIGPPCGQTVVHPTRPGRLMFRITAECEWGRTTVVRTVEITAPKVRIVLLQPAVRAAHPGEEVRFEWKAVGAESVWLIAPGCSAPQRVIADGLLFVPLGWQPAEFQLIARGYGGAEKSVTFRAVPQPFACLESGQG